MGLRSNGGTWYSVVFVLNVLQHKGDRSLLTEQVQAFLHEQIDTMEKHVINTMEPLFTW